MDPLLCSLSSVETKSISHISCSTKCSVNPEILLKVHTFATRTPFRGPAKESFEQSPTSIGLRFRQWVGYYSGVMINRVLALILVVASLCSASVATPRQGDLLEASRMGAVDTLWESNDTPAITLWQPSGNFNVGDVVSAPRCLFLNPTMPNNKSCSS